MKNKPSTCLAHLVITAVTAILLVMSASWLINNLSRQKIFLNTRIQILTYEANAPSYFQSHGITSLTPQMITAYDQQFGTNLYSRIAWPTHQPNTKKQAPNKNIDNHFGQPSLLQTQSPAIYVRSPEMGPSPIPNTTTSPTTPIQSLPSTSIPLSTLEESVANSTVELDALEMKGAWNYLLSFNITVPGTSTTILGLFLLTMLKKIFEDFYLPIKLFSKRIWNLSMQKIAVFMRKFKR